MNGFGFEYLRKLEAMFEIALRGKLYSRGLSGIFFGKVPGR
jgi:hypothetical protein